MVDLENIVVKRDALIKRDALKKLRKSINELIIVVSGTTMETPMILGFARKFPCQCRPELTG